ncbi:MAG: hypothetical protein AB9856_02765 [Cellulosilyticaceae bacterium]
MQVNTNKTIDYYKDADTCNCEYCKTYIRNILGKYISLEEYFNSLGVNILKPFELIMFENKEEKTIEYVGCQYIVFGECEEKFSKIINGIKIENNLYHHPSTGIEENHFILDFGPIILE